MKTLLCLLFFGFSFQASALESKLSLDQLHAKHGVVMGDLSSAKIDEGLCSAGFRVHHRQFFQTRRGARGFCDDIHRFTRFNNLCFVRQYSDNFYGASFNYVGFASGNSFFGALQNVLDFLDDTGLLNEIFNFVLQLDGSRGC